MYLTSNERGTRKNPTENSMSTKKELRQELAKKVLSHLQINPNLTMGQIAKGLTLESKDVRPAIRDLRKQSLITSEGERRATRYSASN